MAIRRFWASLILSLLACFGCDARSPFTQAQQTLTQGDSSTYQAGTGNGFWYSNTVYNTNGQTEFAQTRPSIFPEDSLVSWSWPNPSCGAAFVCAYPEIIYGRGGGFSNPLGVSWPGPEQISALKTLTVSWSVKIGGNQNSYDVLIDDYLMNTQNPANTSCCLVAEVSFFPYQNFTGVAGALHQFTGYYALVEKVGTQIEIFPCNSSGTPISMLSGTINVVEIFNYLIAQGFITSAAWVQGIEIGAEVQSPQSFNAAPYVGSYTLNSWSINWE